MPDISKPLARWPLPAGPRREPANGREDRGCSTTPASRTSVYWSNAHDRAAAIIVFRPASADESGALVDLGRFTVTGKEADRGAFKTPTLREVARTAPYMHDGSFATLDAVIDFYDRGGNANPFRDRELRPLGLSEEEKQALLAFLRSLSGDVRGAG